MTRINNDQKIKLMELAISTIGTKDPIKTIDDIENAIEKVYTKIVSLIEDDEKQVKK